MNLSSRLIFIGLALIGFSFAILTLTFFPILSQEVSYSLSKNVKKNNISPIDKNFGVIIPKINANAKVIPNVDPYSEREYQVALTKGVAHAKGTALPNETGNIFLFSHSSQNFYEANRYNSIFYLLEKLEKGDSVYLFYKNKKYEYKVKDKKIVDASLTSYLTQKTSKKTLTLMTCWPPGTTFKRLLVIGELLEN